MTEKIKCKLKYSHFGRECTEELFVNKENPEKEARQLLENFNNEERRRKKIKPDYHEDIRNFISVEIME